jgi:hypothetical protein
VRFIDVGIVVFIIFFFVIVFVVVVVAVIVLITVVGVTCALELRACAKGSKNLHYSSVVYNRDHTRESCLRRVKYCA